MTTLITDSDALAQFCARQKGAQFVAVDTEFMRERTYWPVLCVVQVAGPEEAVAIDALAPGIALAPLLALMADSDILKVFHAARQDLEIFFQLSGQVPHPIFDTQIAAMVCGFGDSASYETLVKRLARTNLDKASRFTDWAHRPLTARQIEYALADVVHLRTVYERLQELLAKNGRAGWFAEEMADIVDPALYRAEPSEAWRRFRLRGRADRRMLGVLRAVAAWREAAAQQRDLPRGRIMRDEAVLEVAAHAPKSIESLARTRSLGKGVAEGKLGHEILDAVAQGLADPNPPPAIPGQGRGAARRRAADRAAAGLAEAAVRGFSGRAEAGRLGRGSRSDRRRRQRAGAGLVRLAARGFRQGCGGAEAWRAGADRRQEPHRAGASARARRGLTAWLAAPPRRWELAARH